MTSISAVLLDTDLKEDIELALDRQKRLKSLDQESNRYLNAEYELDELYREIGWQLVWNVSGGSR